LVILAHVAKKFTKFLAVQLDAILSNVTGWLKQFSTRLILTNN